jgi:hypothetical protein
MSQLDKLLILKYNQVLGLDNIINVSGNTLIDTNFSVSSLIKLSGNTYIFNNISSSSIFLNTNNLYLQDISTNNIYISGNTTFLSPINSIQRLSISTPTVINNILSTNILANSISCITPINTILQSNIITTNVISSNTTLNIIGVSSLSGQLYISTPSFIVNGINLCINQNRLNIGTMNTGLSGIEIMSFSSIGYLRNSFDQTRWEFKSPQNNTNYTIVNLDTFNSLYVTGLTNIGSSINSKKTFISNSLTASVSTYSPMIYISNGLVGNVLSSTTLLNIGSPYNIKSLTTSKLTASNINVPSISNGSSIYNNYCITNIVSSNSLISSNIVASSNTLTGNLYGTYSSCLNISGTGSINVSKLNITSLTINQCNISAMTIQSLNEYSTLTASSVLLPNQLYHFAGLLHCV